MRPVKNEIFKISTILPLCMFFIFSCALSKKHSDESPNNTSPDSPSQPTDPQKNSDPSNSDSVKSTSRQLGILKNSSTGKLSFGVTYTLASDPDGVNWRITFSTDLSSNELAGLPACSLLTRSRLYFPTNIKKYRRFFLHLIA
jgi:hypothetical protein